MKGSFHLRSLPVCIHQAPADSVKSLKQSESGGLQEYLMWFNESRGESAKVETEAHNQWHRLPGFVWLTGFFVFINDGELVQQGRGLLGEFFKHLGNAQKKISRLRTKIHIKVLQLGTEGFDWDSVPWICIKCPVILKYGEGQYSLQSFTRYRSGATRWHLNAIRKSGEFKTRNPLQSTKTQDRTKHRVEEAVAYLKNNNRESLSS